MNTINRLIFDVDDTLWANNIFYERATKTFLDLCHKNNVDKEEVQKEFNRLERWIVQEKGYGSDNYVFILNELYNRFLSDKNSDASEMNFKELVRDFRSHLYNTPPVFHGIKSTLKILKRKFEMFILTKGDEEEQKRKVYNSRLSNYFSRIFVVQEKNTRTYKEILFKHGWIAAECCMIGNSPKSDINPALKIGMYAIFVPYTYTWKLDDEQISLDNPRLREVNKFREIPDVLNLFN